MVVFSSLQSKPPYNGWVKVRNINTTPAGRLYPQQQGDYCVPAANFTNSMEYIGKYDCQEECEGTGPCLWLPIRGSATITCVFNNCDIGTGPYHNYWAVDFISQNGTPIYASGAGVVSITETSPDGSCSDTNPQHPANEIIINHGNNIFTAYRHLGSIQVSNGQNVDKNTVLGTLGSTGYTIPCPNYHLHFLKMVGGMSNQNAVDPIGLLAMQNGEIVSYPSILGLNSWNDMGGDANGLGGQTVYSD